jgi:hypothetical protein
MNRTCQREGKNPCLNSTRIWRVGKRLSAPLCRREILKNENTTAKFNFFFWPQAATTRQGEYTALTKIKIQQRFN